MNRYAVLAVLWTLGILAACSIPGNDLPDLDFNLFEYDKLIHFALFFGFGWLWLSAVADRSPRWAWGIVGLGVAYAVLTEVYQGMLPWDRQPDPVDAIANIAGLFASWVVFARTRRTPRT